MLESKYSEVCDTREVPDNEASIPLVLGQI